MLSPASLRVCCLAVMAPALTKADRRAADCLPVVLPFCEPKTAALENRKDKFQNDFSLARFPSKFANLLKRKSFPHKIWLRTLMRNGTELSDRHRICPPDVRKSPLSVKGKLNPDVKIWHGGSATLAVADKVRSKYTMNRSSSSFRNMGLAKANASLGYHRRMNRFASLSHKEKRSPSNVTQEAGDSSPELPDHTNSDLESPFRILRIVQPVKTPLNDEVMSTKIDLTSSSNCDESPDTVETSAEELDHKVTFLTASLNNKKISPHDTDLPDIASLPECSIKVEGRSSELTISPMIHSVSSILPPPCDNSAGDAAGKEVENASSLDQDSVVLPHSIGVKESDLQDISEELNLEAPLSPVSVHEPGNLDSLVDEKLSFSPPASPTSHLESDFETASLNGSFTSSTLSADASPLPSSLDEANETVHLTFPDSVLASSSGLIADLPCLNIADVTYLTPKSPLITDTSAAEDRMRKKTCCVLTNRDYSKYYGTFSEIEEKLTKSLEDTHTLMRKNIVDHANSQLRTLVGHLQRQSGIPCQKPMRPNISKPALKDIVALKAELLQSEDVKHMSTAALVSLVRKLESGASPSSNLLYQKPVVQEGEMLPKEGSIPAFAAADCQDVKYTSNTLLKSMKNLLRIADPDMTDSSDDESSDELDGNTDQKRALWKFLKERAALASRSTWLIARIHELENQLRSVSGILKKLSVEELCFEEQVSLESSATDISSTSSLKASKTSKPKVLGRTVNGCLDHSSVNNAISVGLQLDSDESDLDSPTSCSRTRALELSSFHKRKLLVTTGLHLTNSKVAKLSTVGCVCNCEDALPCVLCTGRYNCVQSVDPDTLPLFDRIALLDPSFHPLLSFEKDIPLLVHFENTLKKNEAQYQVVRPSSPSPSYRDSYWNKPKHYSDTKSRSRKLNKYARTLLSSKYRNKKHFRKHKLVFGKWRKLQNKSSFKARDRIRRYSVASSGSSHDSPIPSPLSAYDDGSGHDTKRRREDNQYDINDVIIPYSSKRGRLVKFEFKDIEIPSWRSKAFENLEYVDIEEDTTEAAFVRRHESYEVEERKIIRNGGGALCFFNTWQKRARRHHRSDSRADSSGANTPDPPLNCDQDVFQDSNNHHNQPPSPPALLLAASDDSRSSERRRATAAARAAAAAPPAALPAAAAVADSADEAAVPPYEPRVFPLPDATLEELVAESDHIRDDDVTVSGPSCPASPASTSSTSTMEDDDITDPEWTVVRNHSGPEQPLVLKFAKR